jgi:hypothetical protein
MQFIIVHGDVVDGFNFVGPYEDVEDAAAHAAETLSGESWHVAELESSSDYTNYSSEVDRVRIIRPASGGVPSIQMWHADDGEPLLRSDFVALTRWLEL